MNQYSELLCVVCCVCGKKEERDETFKTCQKCAELNIVSEVFCSEKCFRSAWNEHKKIHERKDEIANPVAQALDLSTKKYFSETIEKVPSELKKHRKETGETIDKGVELKGVELYLEGQKAFMQHDFITAETKLRKHIKKAPLSFGSTMLAYPNAFYMLGQIYNTTRTLEAAAYLEKGAQTAARMLFMNEVYGHTYDNSPYHALHSDNIPKDIMDIIHFALTLMCNNTNAKSYFEADWALNDHKLKKLVRYSIQLYQKHEISKDIKYELLRFTSYTCFFMGQICHGKKRNNTTCAVRCVADVKEALEWKNKLALLSGGAVPHDVSLTTLVAILDSSETIPSFSQAGLIIEKDEIEIYDGRWVTINGLTSQVGQSMNGKLALVKGSQVNGRFPVVVKENETPKSIKIENLKPFEMTEDQEALVILLPSNEQWTYMSMLYNMAYEL